MLCDEVYGFMPEGAPGRELVAAAHKFVLTEELCVAAANISKSNADFMALRHLFRLPHNLMWLESRPRHLFNCGILMEQYTEEQCRYLEQQVSPLMHPIQDAIHITQVPPCREGIPYSWIALPHTLKICDDGVLQITLFGVTEPLNAEKMSLLAHETSKYSLLLAVLNSRNLIETETSDLRQLNRARERRGKLPLFEHKVIHINPDIRHAMCEAQSGVEENHTGVRAHWRRGHFKIRKTGVFWWSPHMAGKAELGQIEKQYVA